MGQEERNTGHEKRTHGDEPRVAGACGIESCRPRNWLVPVILLTLRESNSYGYEIMERMAAFGFEAMNPGTLYRTLRQMEKDGLCESRWETSRGGPARRVYTIADAGRRYLDLWAQSLKQYQEAMDAFLRAYYGPDTRS